MYQLTALALDRCRAGNPFRPGGSEGPFFGQTVKIGRENYHLMLIYNYAIDAQQKRDMRRRHPDVDFDWKTITRQLVEKREVCRRYRSRRRTARATRVREPF